MPPKTAKKLLCDALEDLDEQDFKKFCHALVDRQEEPRVRKNRVQGKSFLDVADVLVSTFTDREAVKVATELLREVDCRQDAEKLAKAAALQSSASTDAKAAGLQSSASTDEHFVDKHRPQLIQRVSNIPSILDLLLKEKVIQNEAYGQILAEPTSQAKMRAIYDSSVTSCRASKDIFYRILKHQEPFLISELEGN